MRIYGTNQLSVDTIITIEEVHKYSNKFRTTLAILEI